MKIQGGGKVLKKILRHRVLQAQNITVLRATEWKQKLSLLIRT